MSSPMAYTQALEGVATGEPDLWCTFAAVRTLAWLGSVDPVPDRTKTMAYLASRLNSDGGYAWSRGMASDAWATYYCTQAISDMGGLPARRARTAEWLRATFADGAYAMAPGQRPDVWATHFSTNTAVKVCTVGVPDPKALRSWLSGLQTLDGGLTWSPDHASACASDVRASHYGILAWRALHEIEPIPPPWRIEPLITWIRAQQLRDGGFRFGPQAAEPCLWATYRATASLRELNDQPANAAAAVSWIMQRRGEAGSFVRWSGYPVEDVWAAFCAVGALRALGEPVEAVADAVRARIRALACPGGGFTYREPELAADALSTAAAVLRAPAGDPRRSLWRAWLDGCQLPNEGGVMYMPARGAEIRCTLWALAAGALTDPDARKRVGAWLTGLQNPDGGFGYWEGRGSDLVSTAAAVEIAIMLGEVVAVMDVRRLAAFVTSCTRNYVDGCAGAAPVPGGEPTLRAGLQAARIRAALGQEIMPTVARLLESHRVAGGGYANTGARMPDLISTYDAVATAARFGLEVDGPAVEAFLRRVTTGTGTAWSPLAPANGGPMADCLGALLARHLSGRRAELPMLALS